MASWMIEVAFFCFGFVCLLEISPMYRMKAASRSSNSGGGLTYVYYGNRILFTLRHKARMHRIIRRVFAVKRSIR